MFRNATFKLTISYLCVVMVISLIFSAVVYRVGSDNLAYGLNRESRLLSSEFPIFNGTQYAQPSPATLNSGRQRLLDQLILTNLLVLIGAGFISYFLARETLKPIEDAHDQQQRFTADVSHELRTPLTALKMESEVALIDDKMNTAELRQVITSNIEEAAKLDTLINNLLKLTRLEAGEFQQQFAVVNLNQVLDEAAAEIAPQANRRGIELRLINKGNVSVNGDRDSLLQLAVIFLDNAVKYSTKETVVKAYVTEKNNLPQLIVEDQGPGIAPADLEHIFDRFYRADNGRSGSSGFGLGLSIAKLIADIHHADITISSQLKKGTKAIVSFGVKG